MATFAIRKTAPKPNNKYWYTNINIWTKKGIGTCTRTWQGRVLELCARAGVPARSYVDTWYPIDLYYRCSEIKGTKASKPNNGGCGVVWEKKDGSMSHVASVEKVYSNGDISVFQCSSKEEFSYVKITKSSGYKLGDEWTLVGFINLNLKWDESSTSNKDTGNTTDTTGSIVAGKKITLSNTKCYTSETAKDAYGTKSGTFYLWDDVVKNGRIRITNKPERVGVAGQVTCWIDTSSIK